MNSELSTFNTCVQLYHYMLKSPRIQTVCVQNKIMNNMTANVYTGWSKSLCTPDDYSTISTQLTIWRRPSQNTFGMWTVLYWTRSSRTQFGVSINVWRLVGDTLNIIFNFLYCDHQVHRDFLITLHNVTMRCTTEISFQMVIPINPLWSHFLLLYTVHTYIVQCYLLLSGHIIFLSVICLHWFCFFF
jgi:hypothetical protein